MEIEYSKNEDVLYIRLSNGKIYSSEEINDGLIVDYNKKGKILGIEILNASERLFKKKKVILNLGSKMDNLIFLK